MAMSDYQGRRRTDRVMMGLSWLAAGVGLAFLGLILITLVWKGATGINLAVFTQNTPGPGSQGGLLNAIIGSLVLTIAGVVIGAPVGLLAGTWMAEYGRHTKLASLIRFINDILLSAPSIIIGLFVYEVVVVPMGHFSAFAGMLALAVLVVPVVIRTTEDMLLLVPNALREAAAALGMPRSRLIIQISWRAAKAGLMTGLLLAVARVSGETAPLLFTALSSPYLSFNVGQPMANLPVIISNFAGSPYENWQQLAWTGALLITVAVLTLSIAARIIGSGRAAR